MVEATEVPAEPAAPVAEVPPVTNVNDGPQGFVHLGAAKGDATPPVPEVKIPEVKLPEVKTPETKTSVPAKSHSFPSKGGALLGKAKGWAKDHPKLAIGGVAGTAALVTMIAAAYPLWKKVIQPHLAKLRKERATGRGVVKRSVEDEYLDELVADTEFLEQLSELADLLEE